MNINEFSRKWDISKSKVKKMLPFLQGITYCEYCKKPYIPDDAVPFYIPDKREYRWNDYGKKICYILDAICTNMVLSERFCGMNDNEVSSIVNQLSENGIIEPKQGVSPDSKDYRDYIISIKTINWQYANGNEKKKFVIQIFNTIGQICDVIYKNVSLAV